MEWGGRGGVKEPESQCARVCQNYPLANYPLVSPRPKTPQSQNRRKNTKINFLLRMPPLAKRDPRWPDPEFPRRIAKKKPLARHSGLAGPPRKYQIKTPKRAFLVFFRGIFWYVRGTRISLPYLSFSVPRCRQIQCCASGGLRC